MKNKSLDEIRPARGVRTPPRRTAIAWAFVAHTDSRFDVEVLSRFVRAYQRVQPLTIGELWAVAITLRIVLVDLASTPEPETHGRFVDALRQQSPDLPLMLVGDEGPFRRRFATLPGRVDERRAAWEAFARARDLAWFASDLEAADPARDAARLGAALRRLQGALEAPA